MSSIESAPQTIPATTARTFSAAFAPPFAVIVSRSASSLASPHRCASAITGTSPAQDTRFGWSNLTDTALAVWDDRI